MPKPYESHCCYLGQRLQAALAQVRQMNDILKSADTLESARLATDESIKSFETKNLKLDADYRSKTGIDTYDIEEPES